MFDLRTLLEAAETGSWQFASDSKLADMASSCNRILQHDNLSKQNFDKIRVLLNRIEKAVEAQRAVK